MAEVCVAHLVRAQNGVEPFRAFIDSYREHDAGLGHVLLLIFKGFEQTSVPEAYRGVPEGITYRTVFVADEGFDLGAYFAATEQYDFPLFCFLNSFSRILDSGWLAHMHRHIAQKGVGLVGATASYESHYANYLSHIEEAKRVGSSNPLRRLMGNYRRQQTLRGIEEHFAPFPNYHIRTNAFMISRALFLGLKRGPFREKIDAERFESGKNGLTRQLLEQGLSVLVAGRDGKGYEKEEWPQSRTFRSGHQENLLVADNRTQQYQDAGASERLQMREQTWGKSKS